MTKQLLGALLGVYVLVSCSPVDSGDAAAPANPPAADFNAAGSDPEAIEIADTVMRAMGGREAWDRTRYLAWRFFAPAPDGRTHVWDKETGQVRYEMGDQLTLVNIHSREGKSWKAGQPIEDPDELATALQEGYEAWVNDSYWLLMPYKLKDSGVTLAYLGERQTEEGRAADVLQLTFEAVGVTPDNKYHVWVDRERSMVEQWAFFAAYDDEEPGFTTPWANWSRRGEIMLSGDRGQVQLTEIAVLENVPDSVFTSPDPVDMVALGAEP